METSELDELLEEVLEKEKTAKKKMKSDDGNKRKIIENEKTAAKDMLLSKREGDGRAQVWLGKTSIKGNNLGRSRKDGMCRRPVGETRLLAFLGLLFGG